LVAAAHLSTQGANKDALHSKLYQTVHAKQRGRWQFACPLPRPTYIAVSVLRTTFNGMPIFSSRFWKLSSERSQKWIFITGFHNLLLIHIIYISFNNR